MLRSLLKSTALCRCLLRCSYRGIWSPVPPPDQLPVYSSLLRSCSSASWSLFYWFYAACDLVNSIRLFLNVLLSVWEQGDAICKVTIVQFCCEPPYKPSWLVCGGCPHHPINDDKEENTCYHTSLSYSSLHMEPTTMLTVMPHTTLVVS